MAHEQRTRLACVVALTVATAGVLGCKTPELVARDIEPPAATATDPGSALFVDLFVDYDHGCALARDGRVWCWGEDPAAKLELRPASDRWNRATQVAGVNSATVIDGDWRRTCAVLVDGQVLCWQAPLGKKDPGAPPERVPGVTDAVDLVVSGGEVCVRTTASEVHCSSIKGEGRRQVASNAIDFAVADGRACALDPEGGVWCWGRFATSITDGSVEWAGPHEQGPNGELLMARLPGAVQVEVGRTGGDLLVRLRSGEVLIEPRLGPTDALPITEYLAPAGTSDAVALAYRGGHGCIVAQPAAGAREVRCFQGNGWAQLGAGDSQPRAEAVTMQGLGEVVDVAASTSLSCATTRTGVHCWGSRLGPLDPLDTETKLVATDVASMTVGPLNTCVSTNDGQNLCWGSTNRAGFERDGTGIFHAAAAQALGLGLGRLAGSDGWCFYDDAGHMRWANFKSSTFAGEVELILEREGVTGCTYANGPCYLQADAVICEDFDGHVRATPKLRHPTAIAAAGDVLCAVHDRGKMGCFALPELDGEDHIDPTTPAPELIEVPRMTDAVALVGDIESSHPCFLILDQAGVTRMICLPENGEAVSDRPLNRLALDPADKVILTQTGVCALTKAGTIMCQHYSDGEIETHEIPDPVDIASRSTHWCALSGDGTLTCVGDNRYGQLGEVPKSVIATPIAIEFE